MENYNKLSMESMTFLYTHLLFNSFIQNGLDSKINYCLCGFSDYTT